MGPTKTVRGGRLSSVDGAGALGDFFFTNTGARRHADDRVRDFHNIAGETLEVTCPPRKHYGKYCNPVNSARARCVFSFLRTDKFNLHKYAWKVSTATYEVRQ